VTNLLNEYAELLERCDSSFIAKVERDCGYQFLLLKRVVHIENFRYVCVRMYIHLHIYIHTHVHLCVCMSETAAINSCSSCALSTSTTWGIYIYIYIYTSTHVYLCMCMSETAATSFYICLYINMHIYLRTCTQKSYRNLHIYGRAFLHTRVDLSATKFLGERDPTVYWVYSPLSPKTRTFE